MTGCAWCPTGEAKYDVQGKPTCGHCMDMIRLQNDEHKLRIRESRF